MRSTLFLLLLSCVAGAALSQEFGARYPAGSIATREQADRAIKAAQQEEERLRKLYEARDTECYSRFLVNDCREKVRRERELALRDVRRVEVDAKGTRRKLDQEDLERRRAEDRKQQQSTAAEREQREKAQSDALDQRKSDAAERAAGATTPDQAARNKADYERRQKEHADRLAQEQARAAERAANAAAYQDKQAEAAKRAETNAAEVKRREERRAERKKALEQKEAEREALRKKAEEAAATLPR